MVHGVNNPLITHQQLSGIWQRLKNGHYNNTCEDNIGPCFENTNTILDVIIDSKGRACVIG